MLEMRLQGSQEDIERFLNEIFWPRFKEIYNDNQYIKITENDGKYYANERYDKQYKRRYLKLYWKDQYQNRKNGEEEPSLDSLKQVIFEIKKIQKTPLTRRQLERLNVLFQLGADQEIFCKAIETTLLSRGDFSFPYFEAVASNLMEKQNIQKENVL